MNKLNEIFKMFFLVDESEVFEMNENKKAEDMVQNIPEYEKLTDTEKLVLAVAIKNILSQYSSAMVLVNKEG